MSENVEGKKWIIIIWIWYEQAACSFGWWLMADAGLF
jgi:hypothetical protein